MFLFVFLAVSIIAFLYIYKVTKPSPRHLEYGNKIPGPKPVPIFGNALELMQAKTVYEKWVELSKKYGPIFRLWVGKDLFVVITNPDDTEAFLSRARFLNKSNSYRLLDPWLGDKGLLTSDEEVWRLHRKQITPSFHFKMLENAMPMITENAQILCQQLKNKADQPEFDIQEFFQRCSFDIICETAMGAKYQTQTSKNNVFFDSLRKVCKASIARVAQPWLHPEFIFKLCKYGRNYDELLSVLEKERKKVIIERKSVLEKSLDKNQITRSKKPQPQPFLDFLLKESNFTDKEIDDEVQNFMFAGHDTTTSAMSFCMYALSNNERVQNKLVEELKSVLVRENYEPTYHDYMNLKYLEMIIKETLRMYTTVPMIARKVDEDFKLPSGYFIPAGSLANLFLQRMHNDEDLFPNPEQFIPERFEDVTKHPFQFVPFSAGPRNCIGQKFAMLEMKICISTVLLKYKLLPATKTKKLTLEFNVVLRSLNKIPIRLTPRNL
ncbi:hypothetical protein PGB90_002203 [Kerria lacca]